MRIISLSEREVFGGLSETEAGVKLSFDRCLTVSTVWACASLIADSLASLPWHVYRESGGIIRRDEGHPINGLLSDRPNPDMSIVDFLQTMLVHCLLKGNAYGEIVRDRDSIPLEIWPIATDRVEPYRADSGELRYRFFAEQTGKEVDLPSADVFHLKGLSLNGLVGLSVVAYMRETLGLTIAAESYGSRQFKNDARPSLVVRHPGQLGEQGIKNLRDSIEYANSGANQRRTLILEEGAEVTPIGIPPEDAQFLQTRQFQVLEIARWFRVPPHMIGELSRATFSNIEHQSLAFVRSTLLPWARRLEAEADSKLIGRQRGSVRHRSRINLDEFARADQKTRYEAHQVALLNGIKSIDEVRAEESLNALPRGLGASHRVPVNTEQLGPGSGPDPRPGG
ncbi:MAG: phage portal protein [Phycisphaerales bacterium JB050]